MTVRNYKGKTFTWKIGKQVERTLSNIFNLSECNKEYCRKKYIGITQQEFRERIYAGYVRNKQKERSTGEYFNLPGLNMHDIKFTTLENVMSTDSLYGREREKKLLLRKFNTLYNGINKEP